MMDLVEMDHVVVIAQAHPIRCHRTNHQWVTLAVPEAPEVLAVLAGRLVVHVVINDGRRPRRTERVDRVGLELLPIHEVSTGVSRIFLSENVD
jgi:hypothetical protein